MHAFYPSSRNWHRENPSSGPERPTSETLSLNNNTLTRAIGNCLWRQCRTSSGRRSYGATASFFNSVYVLYDSFLKVNWKGKRHPGLDSWKTNDTFVYFFYFVWSWLAELSTSCALVLIVAWNTTCVCRCCVLRWNMKWLKMKVKWISGQGAYCLAG